MSCLMFCLLAPSAANCGTKGRSTTDRRVLLFSALAWPAIVKLSEKRLASVQLASARRIAPSRAEKKI